MLGEFVGELVREEPHYHFTATGFTCTGTLVSSPLLSAACVVCDMTAMPGMPKAYTPIVCVLSLGVSEEHPLAENETMPPPTAPMIT